MLVHWRRPPVRGVSFQFSGALLAIKLELDVSRIAEERSNSALATSEKRAKMREYFSFPAAGEIPRTRMIGGAENLISGK
jgi:hypothetical protein